MKQSLSNDKKPQKTIIDEHEQELSSELYKKKNIVFDVSFKGCFHSVDEHSFNNCLKDASDFVSQYRVCVSNLQDLSGHTIYELMSSGGFRHCHDIKGDSAVKALDVIKELCRKTGLSDRYFEQNIENETIWQLGHADSPRFFGIVNGNVFRLLFIDYFHDLSYNETRNNRNTKNYKFCPITSEL